MHQVISYILAIFQLHERQWKPPLVSEHTAIVAQIA